MRYCNDCGFPLPDHTSSNCPGIEDDGLEVIAIEYDDYESTRGE